MGKAEMLEEAVKYMEAIAACPEHGYSQPNRMGVDYDCSTLISRALAHAGFDIRGDNTTRTLKAALEKIGFEVIAKAGNRKRGDILLTPGAHVACMVSARRLVHAVSDEDGGAQGKKPGDQTGKEIMVQGYYDRKGGWTYLMRLVDNVDNVDNVAREVIAGEWGVNPERRKKLIAAGYDADIVQARVNAILKGGKG